MAPGRVVTRVARIQDERAPGDPAGAAALAALTAPSLLERCAEQLRSDPVDVIGYASTTTGYVVGSDAERAMVTRLTRHTGLPVAATCAAAVGALRALQVRRVALVGAPWFEPEFNQLAAGYFTGQGFEVVGSSSAELALDPAAIEPDAVVDWVAGYVPQAAEAVFIGGNGFRTAAAIEELEVSLDRPVLTANQVLLWQMLAHADAVLPIAGYGRLFTHKP